MTWQSVVLANTALVKATTTATAYDTAMDTAIAAIMAQGLTMDQACTHLRLELKTLHSYEPNYCFQQLHGSRRYGDGNH